MSVDESFLARWSRRKRVGAADREQPPAPTTENTVRGPTAGSRQQAAPPVDPANLPPIESIGAGSDIVPFLAPGVPAELMRAALRRAWSADPAIRDFIGLAENSWDFTAPGGVPGFGSVTAEEVERLLVQLAGEPEPGTDTSPAPEPTPEDQPAVRAGNSVDNASAAPCAEPQHEAAARPRRAPSQQRRHGGALPE